jgi:hypothetical protein
MTSREKFNEGRCILLQLLHKRSQPSDIIITIFIVGSNLDILTPLLAPMSIKLSV